MTDDAILTKLIETARNMGMLQERITEMGREERRLRDMIDGSCRGCKHYKGGFVYLVGDGDHPCTGCELTRTKKVADEGQE